MKPVLQWRELFSDNFRRYDSMSKEKYNRRGLSYLLMRKKGDEYIIPYLNAIKGEDILEVGIGYGYYKDAYFADNSVTGYDINPQLGKDLGIEVIAGRADEVGKVNREFDRILSFYMTEYLSPIEIKKFIDESVDKLLRKNGIFLTTIIVHRGLGLIYTKLAALKGISKYSYTYKQIRTMLKKRDYRLIPLNTFFGIPMTVLIEIRK